MRLIAIMLSVVLSGCATYAEVRSDANKLSFHLSDDYQTAYRKTVENLLGPCNYSPGFVTDHVYPESNRAEVTISFRGNVALSMDFTASTDGGADLSAYPNGSTMARKVSGFPDKINAGVPGCYF